MKKYSAKSQNKKACDSILSGKSIKKMADDNKPLKYARFAIGKIVPVIIGILIVLYIYNSNEINSFYT